MAHTAFNFSLLQFSNNINIYTQLKEICYLSYIPYKNNDSPLL